MKGIEKIEVLEKGEAGADGETDDGRIDQKAQPVAAQQQEEIDNLGRLLDERSQVAGVKRGAQVGLDQQPAVQQQAEQAATAPASRASRTTRNLTSRKLSNTKRIAANVSTGRNPRPTRRMRAPMVRS